MKVAGMLFVCCFISGCASPPIVPLQNSNQVSLVGLQYSKIEKITGVVDGSKYSGAATKIHKFHYGELDQANFVGVLASEMNEAGAIKGDDGCNVIVNFRSTFYESNSSTYSFLVFLEVGCKDSRHEYQYVINSRELLTTKESWTFNVSKKRSVMEQHLLDLILKDLSMI